MSLYALKIVKTAEARCFDCEQNKSVKIYAARRLSIARDLLLETGWTYNSKLKMWRCARCSERYEAMAHRREKP